MEFQVCYGCKRSFSLPKDHEWCCPFCKIDRLTTELDLMEKQVLDRERSLEACRQDKGRLTAELDEARSAESYWKERTDEQGKRANVAEFCLRELRAAIDAGKGEQLSPAYQELNDYQHVMD